MNILFILSMHEMFRRPCTHVHVRVLYLSCIYLLSLIYRVFMSYIAVSSVMLMWSWSLSRSCRVQAVFALCVLPDGQLASGSHDCTVRIWDPRTGALTRTLEGHTWVSRAMMNSSEGCICDLM